MCNTFNYVCRWKIFVDTLHSSLPLLCLFVRPNLFCLGQQIIKNLIVNTHNFIMSVFVD